MKSLAKILLCATIDHLVRHHPHRRGICFFFFFFFFSIIVLLFSFRSFWNVLSSSCPILPRLSLRNELLDAGKLGKNRGRNFEI
jgi:hypothetical protein